MPARSFRLVSFCFEGFCLETDSCKVFHCQSEPKDAELRPRLAQEKDRVLRALFFTLTGLSGDLAMPLMPTAHRLR